jgi:hypothetical protein
LVERGANCLISVGRGSRDRVAVVIKDRLRTFVCSQVVLSAGVREPEKEDKGPISGFTLGSMVHEQRSRHYVARSTLILVRPLFRYSRTRDAYVLRFVGNSSGPVLRRNRRHAQREHLGAERRGQLAAG